MKKDLKNSILNRIETEKIQPRSRLYFLGKNLAFWSLFLGAIIIGAISFAVILYTLNSTDLAIGEFVENRSLLSHWLTLLPLVWMLAIGLAVGVGIVGLKHTKKGYKIALFSLIGSNILGSLLLGGSLYAAGGGEIVEVVMEERVPFYKGAREKHQNFWGSPEESGRLAGRVESINSTAKTLTLTDPKGKLWTVSFNGNPKIEVKKPIKMKGQVTSEGFFEANNLRTASRQARMHDRIEDHFRKNPELRAKAESYLTPETRSAIREARTNGQRIPKELHEKIREEMEANTTPAQRRELGPGANRPKKSEIRPLKNQTTERLELDRPQR